jgi:hypothetical protein
VKSKLFSFYSVYKLMRKGISIVAIVVLLLSGAHYTIATHFCGGKIAATKVSLSGQLATCGMEGTEESCPSPGNHLKTHCCDNTVKTIGIIYNFNPPATIQNEISHNIIYISYIPIDQSLNKLSVLYSLFTDSGPPGGFSATAVNLDNICALRI